MTSITDPVASYKAEIAQLEAEIDALQAKLDAKNQLSVSSQSFAKLKTLKENEISESGMTVDESPIFNKINEELGILKALTGVELSDVNGFPVDRSAVLVPCNKMRYTVTGLCYSVAFQLRFTVTQTETGVTVSELEVDSVDPVNKDLDPLFDEIEGENWIQGFCHVFVPYAKLRFERRRTLSKILDKFGDVVRLPENISGSQLEFCHKAGHQIIFKVKWDLKVSSSSHDVSNEIKLHVEAPPTALVNEALKQAPEMFNVMVETLGPAGALEALIQSSTNKDGPG